MDPSNTPKWRVGDGLFVDLGHNSTYHYVITVPIVIVDDVVSIHNVNDEMPAETKQ